MARARFDYRQQKDGQWYYLLIGGNGEPIYKSTNPYRDKTDAKRGAKDAKRASLRAKL